MAAKGRKQGTKKDTPAKKRGAVGKPGTPKKKNSGGRRRETQEESSGLEKAREEGFELVKTAGDGNCLFRAVSTALFGTAKQHVLTRRTAVMYQRNNVADFEPFVGLGMETGREMRRGTRAARSADKSSSSSAFERRLDQMYKDGVWGDELEVRALASYFRVAIKVYRREGETFEYNSEAKNGPIRLYFDSAASHYSSLRKAGGKARVVLDFEAEKDRYLGAFSKIADDDNVSTRSTSSKRSFSERDEEEASEEDQPRKKAASASSTPRSQSPARRKASAVSRKGMANMKARQGRDKVSPTSASSSSGVSDVDNSGSSSPASTANSTPPSSADEITAATTTTTVSAKADSNVKSSTSSPPSESHELSAKEQRAVRKAMAAKEAAVTKRVAVEMAEERKSRLAARRAAKGMKSAAVDIVGGAGRVEKRRRTRSAERMVLRQEVPSRRNSSPSIMSQLDGAMDADVKVRSGSRLSTPSDTSSNSGWSVMAHLAL